MSDLGIVFGALRFAAERHGGQTRKDQGTPYLHHLVEVVHELAGTGGVEDVHVLVAGALHDLLEDTEVGADELERRFGMEVRLLVEEVSDDPRLPKAERMRLQVINAPGLSSGAKILKVADKISNVREVAGRIPPGWSVERCREYLDWTERVIGGCRGVNPRLEERYDRVLAEGRARLEELSGSGGG